MQASLRLVPLTALSAGQSVVFVPCEETPASWFWLQTGKDLLRDERNALSRR
jgi:hypothetical protein